MWPRRAPSTGRQRTTGLWTSAGCTGRRDRSPGSRRDLAGPRTSTGRGPGGVTCPAYAGRSTCSIATRRRITSGISRIRADTTSAACHALTTRTACHALTDSCAACYALATAVADRS